MSAAGRPSLAGRPAASGKVAGTGAAGRSVGRRHRAAGRQRAASAATRPARRRRVMPTPRVRHAGSRAASAPEDAVTTTKNSGTKNTASTVALIMPPITPVPMARWLAEPAPLASTSGSTPRMKASEVIRIGRKRRCAASSTASTGPCPAVQVLRELDDQHRVLRRQADDRDQADLEVDVVLQPAQPRGEHHPEHAQRHHQDHRQRDGPALVQRRQAQEHRQQRECEQDDGRGARTASPRATGPSIRNRSRAAAARPAAPSRPAPRPCCGPAPARPRCASPGSRCSAPSASARWSSACVAKADSGTGCPRLFSALRRSRSSGCMRAGASACTTTRCSRPAFGKSFT
jgi:hypothetical protein